MPAAYAEAARVQVAIPSTTHAVLAFTTTRDKGYYREEGLDVELILMSAPDREPRSVGRRRGGGYRRRAPVCRRC